MQISSTSTAYGGAEAQRLLNLLLHRKPATGGQDVPGAGGPAPDPPAPAQDANGGAPGARFASQTLAALLDSQQSPPTSAEIAQKVIGAADGDGDGSLSLDEVEKALGQDTTSGSDALSQAFGKLDTDGDGKLSAAELASAIDTRAGSGVHHGRHGHHAHATSGDLASKIIGAADSDGDGALSAAEIGSALGSGADDSLSQAIASLDSNGDGKLDASELTAAIDAFRTAHRHGQPASDGGSAAAVTA